MKHEQYDENDDYKRGYKAGDKERRSKKTTL